MGMTYLSLKYTRIVAKWSVNTAILKLFKQVGDELRFLQAKLLVWTVLDNVRSLPRRV